MSDQISNDGANDNVLSRALVPAQELMMRGLNWAYDRGAEGFAGFDGAKATADEYREIYSATEVAVDAMIRWHMALAGSTGFAASVGGLITMPVSLPANVVSVSLLQLRLIQAIAHLHGYDPSQESVRTFAILCMTGGRAADIMKEFGIKLTAKMTERAIMSISRATLVSINRAVGFRLVTKAGTTGMVNLSRFVPVVGGLVGGAFDTTTTYAVGAAAKKVFPFRGGIASAA